VGQLNENDNNKNRRYTEPKGLGVDHRIRDTYANASNASNKNALYDAYVKFFRWASDRLGERDGIVCYVSNNSFVNSLSFDGMRKHLLQDFNLVYHLNFKGDAHTSGEKRRREGGNIFNDLIRVSVGITLCIRSSNRSRRQILYHEVPDYWRGAEKTSYLRDLTSLSNISWKELIPDARNNWLIPENAEEFANLIPIGSKDAKSGKAGAASTIFEIYSRGVATSRDEVVYDYDRARLARDVEAMVEEYNGEVDRYKRANRPSNVDDFVRYERIKWSRDLKLDLQRGHYAEFRESKIRTSLYRPFCKQSLFFDRIMNEEVYVFPRFFPTTASEAENLVICLTDQGSEKAFMVMISSIVADLHLVGGGSSAQCFPFYVYDEDGTNRRENITDWALEQFRSHYSDPAISKWDIFNAIYAILHYPEYRARYAEALKKDLPRIPFVPDFRAFAAAGQELAELHLNYETIAPYGLEFDFAQGKPPSYRVEDKMRLKKPDGDGLMELVVNPSLTLRKIPVQALEYKLGNRSALEWVVDQYQVAHNAAGEISADPNRYSSDERYIVDLVGRVVGVSIRTREIVMMLPGLV
jgi:predicted helicase